MLVDFILSLLTYVIEYFYLYLILVIPILSTFFVSLIPSSYTYVLKDIALKSTCVVFLLSLSCLIFFDKRDGAFQMKFNFKWLDFFNINFNFGVDGISIFFIILTTLLIMLCILVNWNTPFLKINLICFLVLEFLLVNVFSILDLLLFYILF